MQKSEKGLRYQLIEGKIIRDNELQVQFDELKEFSKGFIRSQMAQFGQLDPKEEELDSIAARVLGNQDEVKRLSEQLMSQKLLNLYKEKQTLRQRKLPMKIRERSLRIIPNNKLSIFTVPEMKFSAPFLL